MPVYLLSFEAYGHASDEAEAPRFVLRNDWPPRDRVPLAERYRQAIEDHRVEFDADHRRKLIDLVMDAQPRHAYRCFGVGAGPTRLHAVLAWDDRRDAVTLRSAIRSAVGRGMNREFGRQPWLGEGGATKRVRNRTQFGYLLDTYLPKQTSERWTAGAGLAVPA
ncbi:MAG: hypothetical protein AAF790_05425 [Planctomycetota bacterium]